MRRRYEQNVAWALVHLDPPEAIARIKNLRRANLASVCRALEGIAEWATWLARYVDEREGGGCGDQGHDQACRKANRSAGILWCEAFGYNRFLERRPSTVERAVTG
jgi:hypothetical protein